jgi:hypothetical protein
MKRDRDEDEGEGSKKHKRKKSKKKDRGDKSSLKLMLYAAVGEVKKVRKLLDKYPPPDVNTYDGEGNTALHQVRMLALSVRLASYQSDLPHLDASSQLLFPIVPAWGCQVIESLILSIC